MTLIKTRQYYEKFYFQDEKLTPILVRDCTEDASCVLVVLKNGNNYWCILYSQLPGNDWLGLPEKVLVNKKEAIDWINNRVQSQNIPQKQY